MTEHELSQNAESTTQSHDLSITALYTSYTWYWAGFRHAELMVDRESKVVFRITNWALACARLFMWKLTSLKHGLAHRHAMIDFLVNRETPDLVLELAAGLSRRGLTMSESPNTRYVEVDLPHVIARKEALLESKGKHTHFLSRSNLSWLAEDVVELDIDEQIVDATRPVIISEGLVMYMDAGAQRSLWTRIADAFAKTSGGVYVFDFVPTTEQPKPGFVGRLLEWLMKMWTKGQAFSRDERSRDDIRLELLTAGFSQVEWFEPQAVAHEWMLPFPEVSTQQLVFRCVVNPSAPLESELSTTH